VGCGRAKKQQWPLDCTQSERVAGGEIKDGELPVPAQFSGVAHSSECYIAVMTLPGWNDLNSAKRIASVVADITVSFWALMVLFELSALIWKRYQKRLVAIGFIAVAFAVAGEVVERKYGHRVDVLDEERYSKTVQDLNSRIDAANVAAQVSQSENSAAQKKAEEAEKVSSAAQKVAQDAQTQADTLRKQQAPRSLTNEQQQKIRSYLSRCPPGAFEINSSINENDARPYAEQIASIFRNSGWTVKINNSMFTGPDVSGLWLTIQDPKRPPRAAVDLNNALAAAGIGNRVEYDTTLTDPTRVSLSIGFKPNAAVRKP